MDLLQQVLAFIITILVVVSIHEAGHFVAAKLVGIKVIRYSIGFGKPLYRHLSQSGTEYVVGLLPLGGYVKLLDEREIIVPPSEKAHAFNQKPLWARTLVVFAGPLTNLLFAIFGFWLMFMIGVESQRPIIGGIIPNSVVAKAGLQSGDVIQKVDDRVTPTLQKVVVGIVERLGEKTVMTMQASNPVSHKTAAYHLNLQNWSVNALSPDPLKSLGIEPLRPNLPAVIESIEQQSPAALAGLKPMDRITAINAKPIKDWYYFLEFIQKHPGAKVVITYIRKGKSYNTQATIGRTLTWSFRPVGRMGVKTKVVTLPPSSKIERQYPPVRALQAAINETWEYFRFNIVIIKKMIMGQISLDTLGGPIGIFQTADLAFKQGVSVFLGFLGLISIMLAFINILPIPGLDGGHLFNFLIEFLTGKPVPLKYELISIRVGFFILLLIMITGTLNDLARLFLS